MPYQTQKQNFVYPDGLHFGVSVDSGSSFSDVGVLAAGSNFVFNFDKQEVEPGNAAKPLARAKNMTIALEPSALWSWDNDIFQKLSGGLFVVENVAGTPVVGGVQAVAIGYTLDKTIELTGKQAAGTVPTSIVVTEDPSGTPVVKTVGTDFEIVQDANGQWAIAILTSGTMVNTFDFEVASDYTPAASSTLYSGTSSKTIDRFQARFRHYTDVDLTTFDFEMLIFKTEMNAGFQWAKKGANEDGLDEVTLTLTGQVDDSRDENKQLFSMLLAS